MIFKLRNLHLLLNIFLALLIAVVGSLMVVSILYPEKNEIQPAMNVVWPQPAVTLTEKQTFKVALSQNLDPDSVRVMWSVENGQQSGEMLFDGEAFIAQIDTDTWDWKRDNSYRVNFSTLGQDGDSIASASVVVTVGATTITDSENETFVITSENFVDPNSQVSSVIQVPATTSNAPTSPFRVEWIPGPVRNNQQFVFHTEGYSGRELSAFWSAEGGHQNLVYRNTDAAVFVTDINIFGWLWKGAGPYPITFSVTDKSSSAVIASETLELYWKGTPGASDIEFRSKGAEIKMVAATPPVVITSTPTVTTTPSTPSSIKPATPKPTPTSTAVTTPVVVPKPQTTPVTTPTTTKLSTITAILGLTKLYTPVKPAVQSAAQKLFDPTQKKALAYILAQPSAVWLNGDDYETDAYIQGILNKAAADKSVPTFVLYNIVQRDCNAYSSGGEKSISSYKAWIDRLALVFKNAGAIIIVEPDALSMLNCVSGTAKSERLEMIKYAVTSLTITSPKLLVYIDAGHPFWVNPEEMATRIRSAGIESARGFAINISSYADTSDNVTYGTYLSNLLGGKRYVIDSSRNGNGRAPNGEWCNPSGRALGQSGTLFANTGSALDAVLWIKYPGESDGNCNGGPGAGSWWTEYATALYINKK